VRLSIRHLRRFRQVADILMREGFGFVLQHLGASDLLPTLRRLRLRREAAEEPAKTNPVRVRLILESLGPTFVKLGQFISTRPGLVPADYIRELAKLQDAVPPVNAEVVRRLIVDEMGETPEDLFSSFDDQAVASASIAQVHRATLHSGEVVVVKLQRPDIRRVIEVDLELMAELANIAQRRSPWAQLYDFPRIVDSFAETLRGELDFMVEGQNAEGFARNFSSEGAGAARLPGGRDGDEAAFIRQVRFPKVYWDHSTKRMLTLEWIDGIKVNDLEGLDQQGVDLGYLARALVHAISKMIFIDGFFHADPHPGNLMVDRKGRLVFLDHGMVGHLPEQARRHLVKLVLGVANRDSGAIVRAMQTMGVTADQTDQSELQREIEGIMRRFYHLPLSEFNVTEALQISMDLAFKHRIRIPTDYVKMSKALVTVEGVVRELDPTLSVVDVAEPFAKVLVKGGFNLRELRKVLTSNLLELGELARNLPRRLDGLLDRLERGDFRARYFIEGLDETTDQLTRAINRLALSVLSASIILGTALLVSVSDFSWVSRLPLAGIGIAVSATLSSWVLWATVRSRGGPRG